MDCNDSAISPIFIEVKSSSESCSQALLSVQYCIPSALKMKLGSSFIFGPASVRNCFRERRPSVVIIPVQIFFALENSHPSRPFKHNTSLALVASAQFVFLTVSSSHRLRDPLECKHPSQCHAPLPLARLPLNTHQYVLDPLHALGTLAAPPPLLQVSMVKVPWCGCCRWDVRHCARWSVRGWCWSMSLCLVVVQMWERWHCHPEVLLQWTWQQQEPQEPPPLDFPLHCSQHTTKIHQNPVDAYFLNRTRSASVTDEGGPLTTSCSSSLSWFSDANKLRAFLDSPTKFSVADKLLRIRQFPENS